MKYLNWWKENKNNLQSRIVYLGEREDGRGIRHGDHLPLHKYIKIHLHVEHSYKTPTERWQKTSDFPKDKKIPTYLGRAKEKRKKQRQKNRDGTCTSRRELWRRKSFHTLGSPFTGKDGGELQSHGGEHSNRCAEGKEERFPHRGLVPTSTHQHKRLVCSTARAGGGWELRLRLRRSDPRERTGVGCVKTAWGG